jgi:hypothetical protein
MGAVCLKGGVLLKIMDSILKISHWNEDARPSDKLSMLENTLYPSYIKKLSTKKTKDVSHFINPLTKIVLHVPAATEKVFFVHEYSQKYNRTNGYQPLQIPLKVKQALSAKYGFEVLDELELNSL